MKVIEKLFSETLDKDAYACYNIIVKRETN